MCILQIYNLKLCKIVFFFKFLCLFLTGNPVLMEFFYNFNYFFPLLIYFFLKFPVHD